MAVSAAFGRPFRRLSDGGRPPPAVSKLQFLNFQVLYFFNLGRVSGAEQLSDSVVQWFSGSAGQWLSGSVATYDQQLIRKTCLGLDKHFDVVQKRWESGH